MVDLIEKYGLYTHLGGYSINLMLPLSPARYKLSNLTPLIGLFSPFCSEQRNVTVSLQVPALPPPVLTGALGCGGVGGRWIPTIWFFPKPVLVE